MEMTRRRSATGAGRETRRPARPRGAPSLPGRVGAAMLGAALALGLAGDLLLRVDWGVNLALWLAALAGLAALFARRGGGATRARLALAALGVAATLAWRDSPTLRALDLVAVFALLGLAACGGRIARLGLLEAAAGVLSAWVLALAGLAPSLLSDVRWRELPRHGRLGPLLVAVRGLLISLPLLLVFGALFSSADAGFEALVGRLF